MKTFDEAVESAFLTSTDQASIDAFLDRQMAFASEIKSNPMIAECMNQLVNGSIMAIAMFDTEVHGEDAAHEQLQKVMLTAIVSAFNWGLNVGREMEKGETMSVLEGML
jgi:hypothetical protein